eukprot:CAMPEP_0178451958 /NCGR_PEP_ID=MMETSP0689_2-20121128/43973_1 /TAXON_ID=160604 /ORGANISM="Amphidinium massartii, Strain CS-259" /LENGTH=331 /DNA_ID=CAMNT_0020077601 /DNA_START=110 /DNA_END=1105 /DNA_ORIENTATION=-
MSRGRAPVVVLVSAAFAALAASLLGPTVWLAPSAARGQQSQGSPRKSTSSLAARLQSRGEQRLLSLSRNAYPPLIQRPMEVESKIRRWNARQLKLETRQAASQKAKRYLQMRGITLDRSKKAWHLEHPRQGDIYTGYFQHPSFEGDERVEVTVKVISDEEGEWEAERVGFRGPVEIKTDFPVRTDEAGTPESLDVASWLFQRYNKRWRKFSEGPPSEEELSRMTLDNLRFFFEKVAQTENFPDEDTYRKACADPDAGMTPEEFIAWLAQDDPSWMASAYSEVKTPRKIRIYDEDLMLDGDMIDTVPGLILGYAWYNDKPEGNFVLRLKEES